MKKYTLILILSLFIIPSLAFASWWNPFTWNVFKKKQETSQTQVTNVEKERINNLEKELGELKKLKMDTPSVINTRPQKTLEQTQNNQQNDLINKQKIDEVAKSAELEKQTILEEKRTTERILLEQEINKANAELLRLNDIAAQKKIKDEKLRVINKKIADLNAKYSSDIISCSSRQLTPFVESCIEAVNRDYNLNYNILVAEFQQAKYEN
jgi:hypothetical protein